MALDVQARAQRGELARDRAERGQGAACLQRRDGVTNPVGQARERPWRERGQREPVLRDGRDRREQPRRDGVQQVLARAERRVPDRHISSARRAGSRARRAQVDAHGRAAGGGGEVQPLRLVRRVGTQHQGPSHRAAADVTDARLVGGSPVVGGGERDEKMRPRRLPPARLAAYPREHAELRAARRARVGQQVQLDGDIRAADRKPLPERNDPARCRLRPCPTRRVCQRGGHPDRPSARRSRSRQPPHALATRTSLAGGEGQLDVIQDLISDLLVKRAHAGQYLRDPAHPRVPGLPRGSQHRYPASGVSLHRTAADSHRGRGLASDKPASYCSVIASRCRAGRARSIAATADCRRSAATSRPEPGTSGGNRALSRGCVVSWRSSASAISRRKVSARPRFITSVSSS